MKNEIESHRTASRESRSESRLSREVELRERRMLRARNRKHGSVLAGFGFFGLIGWSIVVPTLTGIAIGRWLDRTYQTERSWTLTLLIAGLSLGCLNVWRWISRENKEIKKGSEDGEDYNGNE